MQDLAQFGGIKNRITMLATAYKSYCVSYFTYSAIALTSTSERNKAEMLVFQNRLLRAAGLSSFESRAKFNIHPITTHIETVCMRTLKRIIAYPTHPITVSLPKNTVCHSEFPFNTRFARGSLYRNTFLQKFTRLLRNVANKPGANENLFIN